MTDYSDQTHSLEDHPADVDLMYDLLTDHVSEITNKFVHKHGYSGLFEAMRNYERMR